MQLKRSNSSKVFLRNVSIKSSGKREFSSFALPSPWINFSLLSSHSCCFCCCCWLLGLYKCEVSLEGPSFSSVHGESYLLVVCKYRVVVTYFWNFFRFVIKIHLISTYRSPKHRPIYCWRGKLLSIRRQIEFKLYFRSQSSRLQATILHQRWSGKWKSFSSEI